MSLGLHQGEFNGLTFGEGTPYHLTRPMTLWEWEARTASIPIPRGHGDVFTPIYAGGDTHVLSFAVWGDTLAQAEERIQNLMAAFRPQPDGGDERWLRWRTAGRTWRVRVSPVRFSAPYGYKEARSHIFSVKVAVRQVDPRLYDDTLRQSRIFVYDPLEAASAGVYDLPSDLPLDSDFVTTGVGGETIIVAGGTGRAYPLITVVNTGATDDVESVSVLNTLTGGVFEVTTVIGPAQTLSADMSAIVRAAPGPHVSLDGTSRYGSWAQPREPFYLEPGAVNPIRFLITGDAAPEDVVCRLSWRDTWL